MLGGRLKFINREEVIGWPPTWDGQGLPKLWQYNLHYFDYVWLLGYDQTKVLVLDWVRRNAPDQRGGIAWDPYVISLRLQNWCGYFLNRERQTFGQDSEFVTLLWGSVFLQAERLRETLEFHLLGNHLLENAATLAFVGSCFSGHAARRWYNVGTRLLERELAEQILADGGHIERSPMYQDRVAFLLATLFNTGDDRVQSVVAAPLIGVLEASRDLRLGDGAIALLNDSANGIYHSVEETARFAAAAGLAIPAKRNAGFFALPQMGYFGWRSEDGSGLLCDAAEIGPDYVPGHAHGDIFSFELCHRGKRVIVDSGVHDYELGPMRRYCRSTAAHSTVEVDGEDQCEFWGAFRVARRGRPRNVRWEACENGFKLSGWHDGYSRLPGKPRHFRELRWWKPNVLLVRDRVLSRRNHRLVGRLHLHPDAKVVDRGGRRADVRTPAGQMTVVADGPVELGTELSWYCPQFGMKLEKEALTLSASGSDVVFGFCCVFGGTSVEFSTAKGAVVDGRDYQF